ncbi:MAG: site-specific integrase [Ktedonobacterales bacterium]
MVSSTGDSRPGQKAPRSSRPVIPLALILDEYWRDVRRREISAKTIRNYQQVLRLVSAFWEHYLGRPATLDDVTLANAEAFVDHLLDRGKTASNTQYPR